MANEDKSFKELVDEAPLHTSAAPVVLAGTLSRSDDPSKFILTLGDNRRLTLDVDAVKRHKVLGTVGGQQIVEVDVDPDKVPPDVASLTPGLQGASSAYKFKFVWHDPQTLYWFDPPSPPKSPIVDTHPGVAPDVTLSVLDHKPIYDEVSGPVTVPPGGDPLEGFGGSRQAFAPFALATAHQAPPAAIAAMQASAASLSPGGTGVPDTASIGTGSPDVPWAGSGIPDVAWVGTGVSDIALIGTGVPDIAWLGTGIPDICR